MSTWTSDELDRIGLAEELELASAVTLRSRIGRQAPGVRLKSNTTMVARKEHATTLALEPR